MGSKRSHERMERLHQRFADGAGRAGRRRTRWPSRSGRSWPPSPATASPRATRCRFAYLVYASSWLKRWYPAAFCAALLDAQPMGFYAPHTLVQDARRHGVEVRTPDLNASAATATLERRRRVAGRRPPARQALARRRRRGGTGGRRCGWGSSSVRGIGDDLAEEIADGRPYADPEDLARRVPLTLPQLEALATAGAFDCFGLDRPGRAVGGRGGGPGGRRSRRGDAAARDRHRGRPRRRCRR